VIFGSGGGRGKGERRKGKGEREKAKGERGIKGYKSNVLPLLYALTFTFDFNALLQYISTFSQRWPLQEIWRIHP
jgi:hypothetical protein